MGIALAGFACSTAPADADGLPGGFQESVVFSGLSNPTVVRFSPDGRVFIAQKNGIIKVFDSVDDPTPSVFADLSTEVYNFWDRGLLGMVLDPEFPVRPYIYVLYARDALPGSEHVPQWGTGSLNDGCPTPPGATGDGCVVTGRLSKLTASGSAMTTETPLITDWCQQYPSHSIGSLGFGQDGALYVSGGEGANFNSPDWGEFGNPINPCGDPLGGEMLLPSAEGGALRSQDVRTPDDPTGLSGSLLRIDPDTGLGLPGNPYALSPDINAQRIVAYGLRNPFRFTFRPGTDEVWVGDVGQGKWEEIDRVVDPTQSTADNFGWPCYEGGNGTSLRQPAWDALNVNLCESLYDLGESGVVPSYYAYEHKKPIVAGESCEPGSSSITGLTFYPSGPFPNRYDGSLFFADQARDCVWAMLPGQNGLPDPSKIETFAPGAPNAVDLEVGPEGSLYFADLGDGEVRRISYIEGIQPPVAKAEATPDSGLGPLQVQLSAAGSTDPDGDSLTYAWDLDGDGEFDDSTEVSPHYEYSGQGNHTVSVKVTNTHNLSDTASVVIQVGNTRPTATIESPTSSLAWGVGDQIDYSASASDPEDGVLPASAFHWEIVLNHCPSNCHQHIVEEIDGQSGGDFVAPDHEYPSTLSFKLTVTDLGGLSDTESVTIQPLTVTVTLHSIPTGMELVLNDEQVPTPSTKTVIKGSLNTVSAPSPQIFSGVSYNFVSPWSDGGAATHAVLADHSQTLTANYAVPPDDPTITATSPQGPANDNSPAVSGTVGGGSPTEVELFTGKACSGPPAAVGGVAAFTGAGISVPVADDAATQLSARTKNAAGISGCSDDFRYIEDSTPPDPPVIIATDPSSPANNNGPRVQGAVGGGAPVRVKLYSAAGCAGSPTVRFVSNFTGTGIGQPVADNQTVIFSARAVDAAENDSPCSGDWSYVEDSTPPQTTITSGPRARLKLPRSGGRKSRKAPQASLSFSFESDEQHATFLCKLDGAAFLPCVSPSTYRRRRVGLHHFYVRSIDRAGNVDATPAIRDVTILKGGLKRHRASHG